ncbi:MAG: hypothetical protein N3B18_05560 [Desulfobacterota bacterium]|nr:hypothetical protein [Thermodesulfobacteriota bacterium]
MSEGVPRIVCLPDGSVYNAAFVDAIREHHLLVPDKIPGIETATLIKASSRERRTVRITVLGNGQPLTLYIKQYAPVPLFRILVNLMRGVVQRSAKDEFFSIVELHKAGIPTLTPVAAGIKRTGLFKKESFLITKALDAVRLDDFLRTTPLSLSDKRRLIEQLATLIRSLHDRGFNHRDLYLCHILRDATGQLSLVDLHRLDRHQILPERWRIKDIAALNYSAPAGIITKSDRLFFLKKYLRCTDVTASARLLIRKVLKKTQKMIQHNRARHRTGANTG